MSVSRLVLLLLGLTPVWSAAQSRVAGRVVRVAGRDTIPVRGIPVVLHRVGARAQGPIDTVAADPAGQFAFRFSADTTAAYLLSARYGGIEYFSQPVATNPGRPDTDVVVIVADTSSTVPVLVKQRTLLVGAPDESGTRTVLDWFILTNPGQLTRVAPDTLRGAWGTLLPPEAQNVELADNRMSQFSPEALVFRQDSALIFAPLSPGDKELMLQYRIPGTLRKFVVPADRVTDSTFVMMEEHGGRVATAGFAAADSQMLDGRSFRRWAGLLRQGGNLEILLPSALLSSRQILTALVVGAGVVFALLGWLVWRRRRAAAEVPRPSTPDASFLADAIARLDDRFGGHEADTPAHDWAHYQQERARLLAQLSSALASQGSRS